MEEDKEVVAAKQIAPLVEVFVGCISQAMAPITADLREFRAAMAAQLSRLSDKIAEQNTTLAAFIGDVSAAQKALGTRVSALEATVSAQDKVLRDIQPMVKGAKWAAGILGAALLGLLWSIFTGKVQIVGP